MPQPTAAETRAIEFLADSRFHQSIHLPADPAAGRPRRLRVTYSDLGHVDSDVDVERRHEQPVVLFCGGMFNSRMSLSGADRVAKRYRVRLITTDRPGVGGSEVVKNEVKIQTWLDTVPILLQHLGIRHVTLVSHSAGVMLLLNAALRLRHILHPRYPYLAMMTPWVDPSCTLTTTMALTYLFPNKIVSNWQHLGKFANQHLGPVLDFSSGRSKKPARSEDESEKAFDGFREKLTVDYIFAENIEGVGLESLYCMKRGSGGKNWGACADYMAYVPMLVEKQKEMDSNQDGAEGIAQSPKLKVDVFHAESDLLIGQDGAKYFDSCWSKEQCGDSILYESRVTKGATHDTIMQDKYGVFENILDNICKGLDWEH